MKRLVSLGILAAVLVVVPVATGASSLLRGYGTQGSKAVVQVKSATASKPALKPTKVSSNGPAQLPFTGVDLAVLVVAGAGLTLTGFGVRRLARDKQ